MKRLCALLLTLTLALVATAAFAAPVNVSAISDLPEMPTAPTMTTKLVDDVQHVKLDTEPGWMSAVRNWDEYTPLEFDANNAASFSTRGQKQQIGYAQRGWASNDRWSWIEWFAGDFAGAEVTYVPVTFHKETWGTGGSHEWNYETPYDVAPGYVISAPVLESYVDDNGETQYYISSELIDYPADEYDEETYLSLLSEYVDKPLNEWLYSDDEKIRYAAMYMFDDNEPVFYDEDGRVDILHSGYYVEGEVYDMGYAYQGGDNNGMEYKYTRDGRLAAVSQEVTGANYLESEDAPVKSVVTWSYDVNSADKGIYYISNISEEFEDGTVKKATFAMDGSLISIH